MTKSAQTADTVSFAELLADPIVWLIMKADRVPEQQLTEMVRAASSKLNKRAETVKSQDADPGRMPAEYRAGVGIMLLNRDNDVFVGRRRNTEGEAWQMPQGGIDEGECPWEAAFRELLEEIGTDNAEVLAESKDWLCYDLPPDLAGKVWQGRWRGQRQKWFVMQFQRIRYGD